MPTSIFSIDKMSIVFISSGRKAVFGSKVGCCGHKKIKLQLVSCSFIFNARLLEVTCVATSISMAPTVFSLRAVFDKGRPEFVQP